MRRRLNNGLAKRVSRHKRVVGGVVFVDSVPKNPVSETFSVMDAISNIL